MIVGALSSRVIISAVGTAYPAYRTFKALESSSSAVHEDSPSPTPAAATAAPSAREADARFWLRYWAVWAVLSACEWWADILVAFWVPLYY